MNRQVRARKKRYCDNCHHGIEAGEQYVRHALPPHCDPNSSDHWWVMSTCGLYTSDCRRYWEIDSKVLAGATFIND